MPFIWIYQEDLVLRNEAVVLLKKCGITLDHLLFIEDFPKDYIAAIGKKKVKVTLVDHNHQGSHQFLTNFVSNIIGMYFSIIVMSNNFQGLQYSKSAQFRPKILKQHFFHPANKCSSEK